MPVKIVPQSVTGRMVLDYIRRGERWIRIAQRMGKTESYVRYIDHKYNWNGIQDGNDWCKRGDVFFSFDKESN